MRDLLPYGQYTAEDQGLQDQYADILKSLQSPQYNPIADAKTQGGLIRNAMAQGGAALGGKYTGMQTGANPVFQQLLDALGSNATAQTQDEANRRRALTAEAGTALQEGNRNWNQINVNDYFQRWQTALRKKQADDARKAQEGAANAKMAGDIAGSALKLILGIG